jgi:hypothetical protein
VKRGAWSPRYRPSASGWVYPNSREILAEAFFGAAEEETTDRTGLGPFSRPSLMGVSQRLYGSFAGKAEATDPPEVIDVTDTLSVSLTESVAVLVTIAVTDTLSVQVTEAVEMFKAIEATDTLSVNAGDVASLLQNEAKAVTDTWSVAITDAGSVEATDATDETEEERPSGGYGAQNYYDAWQQRRRRKRDDDEDEDKPEPVAQPATPPEPQPNADLELTRQLVAYWTGEADRSVLTRRAQRALDYALRAETVLAMQLFERELAKQMEEEEIALMLFMLDD